MKIPVIIDIIQKIWLVFRLNITLSPSFKNSIQNLKVPYKIRKNAVNIPAEYFSNILSFFSQIKYKNTKIITFFKLSNICVGHLPIVSPG
jgi:hypothetical protein